MRRFKFAVTICLILIALIISVKNLRAQNAITIWWPNNNVTLNAIQPFKALSESRNLEDYQMFWQVDNGALNPMGDSFIDYPHKEAMVDLTNWNWQESGNYEINFVAKNNSGDVIGQEKINILVPGATAQKESETPKPVATEEPSVQPTPTALPPPVTIIKPVSSELYVDPNNLSVISDSFLQQKIETQPQAKWFGSWNSDVKNDVKSYTLKSNYAGKIPVLVAYNIPNRDCGGYSKGGSNDGASYINWVNNMANGISGQAIVILEPDSVALIECLNTEDRNIRFNLLAQAVQILKNRGAKVYLDAGHPGWQTANEVALRLQKADIAQADGFSLNVANYISTAKNINYGREISEKLNQKHFVIDTGRNGINPINNDWCNPDGMALGDIPTLHTGSDLVDGYLWIKRPGESDGSCNGGPVAGDFWPEYAKGLAQRASW